MENSKSIEEINKFLNGTPLDKINFSLVKDEDIPGSVYMFEFWIEWSKSHDKNGSSNNKQKGGKDD